MICGHPAAAIVSSDEGTAYCAMCALDAENARMAAENERLNNLIWKGVDRANTFEEGLLKAEARLTAARELAARWHKKARPHINGIVHECKELGAWTCIDSCANELEAVLKGAT